MLSNCFLVIVWFLFQLQSEGYVCGYKANAFLFTTKLGFLFFIATFFFLSGLGEAGGKKMIKPHGCQREGKAVAWFQAF